LLQTLKPNSLLADALGLKPQPPEEKEKSRARRGRAVELERKSPPFPPKAGEGWATLRIICGVAQEGIAKRTGIPRPRRARDDGVIVVEAEGAVSSKPAP
jgi:hypothetical protein